MVLNRPAQTFLIKPSRSAVFSIRLRRTRFEEVNSLGDRAMPLGYDKILRAALKACKTIGQKSDKTKSNSLKRELLSCEDIGLQNLNSPVRFRPAPPNLCGKQAYTSLNRLNFEVCGTLWDKSGAVTQFRSSTYSCQHRTIE